MTTMQIGQRVRVIAHRNYQLAGSYGTLIRYDSSRAKWLVRVLHETVADDWCSPDVLEPVSAAEEYQWPLLLAFAALLFGGLFFGLETVLARNHGPSMGSVGVLGAGALIWAAQVMINRRACQP